MKRKPVTQVFPFLLPLRKIQRIIFFYIKMYFDRYRYAKTKACGLLPFCLYESRSKLINENTGFDIKYQENKVFNLHLAAEPVNKILIRPGETFSFWQLVRYAGKKVRYKEGLSLINGKLAAVPGGGLCHLSNFLFWMFLHTPLTIIERHPHKIKDFPSPDEAEPDGVDATVSEGWLDLKVKNETYFTFQIELSFDKGYICGRILTEQAMEYGYEIVNGNKHFFKKHGKIFEQVSVYQQKVENKSGKVKSERMLYIDEYEVGYSPAEGAIIAEGEE